MKARFFSPARAMLVVAILITAIIFPAKWVYGNTITPGINDANRGFAYAYWYTHNGIAHGQPDAAPWDSGVTHAGWPSGDGPWVDFDITSEGTHSFSFQLWGPGPYYIAENTKIMLLVPRNPQGTAFPVTLESIAINNEVKISNERFWFGGSHWNNTAGTYFGGRVNWSTVGTVTGTPTLDMYAYDVPDVESIIPVDQFGAMAGRSAILGDAVSGATYTITIRVGPVSATGHNENAGHINNDNVINSADVTLLRRFLNTSEADRPAFIIANNFNANNADVTGSGSISMADVTLLRSHIAATNPADYPLGGRGSLTPIPDPDPRLHDYLIAFTFDDGPHTVWTPMLLDVAQQFPCPRTGETPRFTFYVQGQHINSRTLHIVERMVREGHHVENHSWGHNDGAFAVNTPGWRTAFDDLRLTNEAIYAATGREVFSFRAPRFSFAPFSAVQTQLGLAFHETAGDPNDWRFGPQNEGGVAGYTHAQALANAQSLATVTLNGGCGTRWGEFGGEAGQRGGVFVAAGGLQDGFNMLFHDAGGYGPLSRLHVVESMKIMIPQYQQMGYGFVTIEQLHRFKGSPPPSTGIIARGSGSGAFANGIVRGNHKLYVPPSN